MNLNKAIIIGRMTADPELRTTSGGKSVTSFGVATNRYWNNDQGERQKEVEFHNVVVWGRRAETVSQFLKKGALVMVEGRLQTRTWEGRDGQKRKTTEIIAQNVQLPPKALGGTSAAGTENAGGMNKNKGAENVEEDKGSEKKEKQGGDEVPEIDIDDLGSDEDEVKGKDVPL